MPDLKKFVDLAGLTTYNTNIAANYVKPSGITVATTTTGEPGEEVTTTTLSFATTDNTKTKTITLAGDGGSFSATGNTLTFTVDAADEYTIGEATSTTTGMLKTYQLFKGGTAVSGSVIDIPKDFLVKSATSSVVTAADKASDGKFENDSTYAVGDAYLDFVVNSVENDDTDQHIYVNVKNLVDTYTAGNGIDITSNEVSVVVDTTNANGLSVGANGIALAAATGSTAGAMSATDKTKLDALATINTVGNGLELTGTDSDTLQVKAATGTNALTVDTNGVAVKYDNDTIVYDSTNGLKLNVVTDTEINALFA